MEREDEEDTAIGGRATPFPPCFTPFVVDCALSRLVGYTSESSEWMLKRSALLSLRSRVRETEDSDRRREIPFELPFRGMEELDVAGEPFVARGPEYPSSLYAGGGTGVASGTVHEMRPSSLFR